MRRLTCLLLLLSLAWPTAQACVVMCSPHIAFSAEARPSLVCVREVGWDTSYGLVSLDHFPYATLAQIDRQIAEVTLVSPSPISTLSAGATFTLRFERERQQRLGAGARSTGEPCGSEAYGVGLMLVGEDVLSGPMPEGGYPVGYCDVFPMWDRDGEGLRPCDGT